MFGTENIFFWGQMDFFFFCKMSRKGKLYFSKSWCWIIGPCQSLSDQRASGRENLWYRGNESPGISDVSSFSLQAKSHIVQQLAEPPSWVLEGAGCRRQLDWIFVTASSDTSCVTLGRTLKSFWALVWSYQKSQSFCNLAFSQLPRAGVSRE